MDSTRSSPDKSHEMGAATQPTSSRRVPHSTARTLPAVVSHRRAHSATHRQEEEEGRRRRRRHYVHSARHVHEATHSEAISLWPPEQQQQQQQQRVDDSTVSHIRSSTAGHEATNTCANNTATLQTTPSVVVPRLHGLRRRLASTQQHPQSSSVEEQQGSNRYHDVHLTHTNNGAVLYEAVSAQHVERNINKREVSERETSHERATVPPSEAQEKVSQVNVTSEPHPPPVTAQRVASPSPSSFHTTSSSSSSASHDATVPTPLGSPLIASRASSLMRLPPLLKSPRSGSANTAVIRHEGRGSGMRSRHGVRTTHKPSTTTTTTTSHVSTSRRKRSRSRHGWPLAMLQRALLRVAACSPSYSRTERSKTTTTTCNTTCASSTLPCPIAASPTAAAQHRTIVRIVNVLHLPPSLQSVAFETLFFFTHVRVYVVLLLVLLTVLLVTQRSVLDDVASTFVVMDDSRPGLTFLQRYNHGNRTLPRKHPVVIVPGFITNALEVWEGDLPCMREQSFLAGSFRQRMQGPQMMYLGVRNTQCWLDLFSLDRDTGLDRPGVRVRADMGFTSVDYFVPGYWVWAKVLVNFADIGYDPQSMAVVTFDWRLSPTKTHERDGFFYSMRNSIKFLTQKNRERAIVLSHSYGTTVALAFFKWADEREPGFMDTYVAYYVNVGGVGVGLPKSLATMLLGDMRDTINIPRPMRTILDSFMNQTARYTAMRTWSCFVAMLPGGCEKLFPHLLTLANGTTLGPRAVRALVRDECARSGHRSCVAEIDRYEKAKTQLPSLPQAPNTTVVCLYGVNRPTETGYVLAHSTDNRLFANLSYFDNETVQGVRLGDGDGTVPLLSLGYMCRAANGWRRNVGRIVTVEFRHDSDAVPALNLRGGTASGAHVDILGNYDFLETLLKIASGMDELAERAGDELHYYDSATGKSHLLHRRVQDRIYSDIDARISTKLQSCLLTENEPIVPKVTAESNPFVCRNDTRRTHLDDT